MKLRIVLTAGIVLSVLALTLTSTRRAQCFTCDDATIDACEHIASTVATDCINNGNPISVCWDLFHQRYNDCLRVNGCGSAPRTPPSGN